MGSFSVSCRKEFSVSGTFGFSKSRPEGSVLITTELCVLLLSGVHPKANLPTKICSEWNHPCCQSVEEKAEIPGEDQKNTEHGKKWKHWPETDCKILRQGFWFILLFEASTRPIFKCLQIPDAHMFMNINVVLNMEFYDNLVVERTLIAGIAEKQ